MILWIFFIKVAMTSLSWVEWYSNGPEPVTPSNMHIMIYLCLIHIPFLALLIQTETSGMFIGQLKQENTETMNTMNDMIKQYTWQNRKQSDFEMIARMAENHD